ncbi:hypothetical protein ACFPDQ_07160 [Pseudofrancisella aestuarii]|uniref:Uncharacterized protein n=1 Tax=Pseudofrancisella aestuarii TaxID=2670347 RepID=A0ABV9TDX5_9GAMM|nr:hypothetical protein [Pseudofrancisella aestuarii]
MKNSVSYIKGFISTIVFIAFICFIIVFFAGSAIEITKASLGYILTSVSIMIGFFASSLIIALKDNEIIKAHKSDFIIIFFVLLSQIILILWSSIMVLLSDDTFKLFASLFFIKFFILFVVFSSCISIFTAIFFLVKSK